MCYKNGVFAVRSKLLLSEGVFLIVILSEAKDLEPHSGSSQQILRFAQNDRATLRMTIRNAQNDRKGSADGDGYTGVGATVIEEPLPFIVDKAFDKDCPCRILSAFLE